MNIKLMNDLAKIPTRGSDGAAGYDLYAATDYNITIDPHRTVMIDTGVAMEIPEGYFGAVFPRSGIASKRGLRLANCVGVIDQDFRGSIGIPLHNDTEQCQEIAAGERVAQLVLIPYITESMNVVDELSDTTRGAGGFGSTGVK